MLSSITPLGQRSRGMSWQRTVLAFWFGAVVAGTLIFGVVGAVGAAVGLGQLAPWVGLVAVGLAAALDLAGVRAPGPQRQVDEDWLGRYRDWVTGLGFGLQLGAGFTTIVPTLGTWALLVIAATSGWGLAAAIGAAFGVGRSVLLLANRTVHSPSSLAESMKNFAARETFGRSVALVGFFAVVLVGLIDVY